VKKYCFYFTDISLYFTGKNVIKNPLSLQADDNNTRISQWAKNRTFFNYTFTDLLICN